MEKKDVRWESPSALRLFTLKYFIPSDYFLYFGCMHNWLDDQDLFSDISPLYLGVFMVVHDWQIFPLVENGKHDSPPKESSKILHKRWFRLLSEWHFSASHTETLGRDLELTAWSTRHRGTDSEIERNRSHYGIKLFKSVKHIITARAFLVLAGTLIDNALCTQKRKPTGTCGVFWVGNCLI